MKRMRYIALSSIAAFEKLSESLYITVRSVLPFESGTFPAAAKETNFEDLISCYHFTPRDGLFYK